MAEASNAKMDQGSTAPKASGPSNRTAPAAVSSALLVIRGCELLATDAGSGCVARTELTSGPWMVLENYRGSRRGDHRGHSRGNSREKFRNRRAKACRELGSRRGSAR